MMARKLAETTLHRLARALDEQRERLLATLEDLEAETKAVRLSETSSERSPDPATAEGGSLVYELEKGFSIAANTRDLIGQVEHAKERLRTGVYGRCESCDTSIPVARLEALPYTTVCVKCASRP